jgi:hypothetical protein
MHSDYIGFFLGFWIVLLAYAYRTYLASSGTVPQPPSALEILADPKAPLRFQ